MIAISVDSVAEFVGQAAQPLIARLASDASVTAFVAELGWDLPSVPAVFGDLHDAAVALIHDVSALAKARLTNGDVSTPAAAVTASFLALIADIEGLPAALQSQLPAQFLTESGIAGSIKQRILDFLLINAIAEASQMGRAILFALGVIEETATDADPGKHQPEFVLREFRLDRLKTFLTAPRDAMADVYGWGTPQIDGRRLVDTVNELSFGLMTPSELAFPSDALVASMFGGLPDGTDIPAIINIPIGSGDAVALEVAVFPAPTASATEAQGLAFRLIGAPQGSISFGIGQGLSFVFTIKAALDTGIGLLLKPDGPPELKVGVESASSAALSGDINLALVRDDIERPLHVVSLGAGGLDITGYHVALDLKAAPADLAVTAAIDAGKLTFSLADGDGFIKDVVPSSTITLDFDLGVGWSLARGFFITGSAGLEMAIPVHLTLGPVSIEKLSLGLRVGGTGIRAEAGADLAITLGPVQATVQGVGVVPQLAFKSGNVGPMDFAFDFLAPHGVGIAIDAGPVHGGGFLSFEDHRYSGVIELSVFAVTVKAFGLIETQLPDGSPGFSFVVIIIAEFTPIQLGFGFTLLGIGGLVGINRTINEQGLSAAVRTGSLEHVLFPRDPVHDAPALIHDLATLFPAAKGHFVLGPMAKLGWGTPTLISADLGIIIEFPGPRLAVLGILRMLLPDPDAAILRLQMAVAGLLDFPAKKLSIDASLFDSTVAGYVVTADMAYRLEFGDNSKFLLSVGGFNSGFSPPAPFPDLRRASVDLGVSGNPSLTASGYFALTSNTAQIGASLQLHASGAGIHLDGWLGFDVMFVFSPFSFTASINAGVRVSFHGVGFGITLHGDLSGPNPWHLSGKVCVSVLWWDACLPVSITFGDRQPAALPTMDPWFGDDKVPVTGLAAAISDPRSWEGTATPAEFAVVSLAGSSTADRTPIDPLGSATLRQKVVPFNRKLEKFGEFKPSGHDRFDLGPSGGTISVVVPPVPPSTTPTVTPVTEIAVVQDEFVPGHFMQLSNAQKLSMPSYVPMDAGVSVAADRIALGSSDATTIDYVTKFIDDEGALHDDAKHQLTDAELAGLLQRSPAALGGVRRTGHQRFMLPARPKKVRLGPALFVVADPCTLVRNSAVTPAPTSQTDALLALREHLRTNPEDAAHLAVVPKYAEAA